MQTRSRDSNRRAGRKRLHAGGNLQSNILLRLFVPALASSQLLFGAALSLAGEKSQHAPDGYFRADAPVRLLKKPVLGPVGRLGTTFGMHQNPVLNRNEMHTGIDWIAAWGTSVAAAGDGIIVEIGRKGKSGNYLKIEHARGIHTTYSHLSRFAPHLKGGQRVSLGEVVGYVGNTGLASGPHLHFELLMDGQHVNMLHRIGGKNTKLAELEKCDVLAPSPYCFWELN